VLLIFLVNFLPEGYKQRYSIILLVSSEPETDQLSLAGENEYKVKSLLDK